METTTATTTQASANSGIDYAIRMQGIVKRFPGVVANDGIDLLVRPGEIHALLGENGAGKSTLMNILFGLYTPDEGEIAVNGKPVDFSGPRDAVLAGLGMVHQHFMLIPRFTVTENIILGNEGSKSVLDRTAAAKRVREISESYGLLIDPDAKVDDLTVGLQQRVEILKALYHGSRILILDEPTALLTPQEIEDLYGILNRLKADGTTIVFITHKLKEVAAVSDKVTVIRRGKTVGERITSDTTGQELADLMVGRGVSLTVERTPATPGRTILSARNLTATPIHGHKPLTIQHLELRAGEILGVCGVEGNGQSELVEVLSGLRPITGGTLTINDTDVSTCDPNGFRAAGLSYIPEDRHHRGLILDFPLWENVLLGNAQEGPFVRSGIVRERTLQARTSQLMQDYDVRAPSPSTPARSLSGGNQQKLIIARELFRNPDVLLAIQPTRGLDVGAIEFVHKELVRVRDEGKAVMLLSYDLDEVMDLSDRIVVMSEYGITGEFNAGEVTRNHLGLLMGGRHSDDQAEA
ncbi:MAG: ABC transporter ATP-binding protein [Thermomicrobiales bacterium]|nr:ABC transporter ATP-binding protein [Thermomicrobiales bacterium]